MEIHDCKEVDIKLYTNELKSWFWAMRKLPRLDDRRYTPRGQKFGFGAARKLPRIDDRKSVNIRNMNRLTIVDPRGFGALQIPSF